LEKSVILLTKLIIKDPEYLPQVIDAMKQSNNNKIADVLETDMKEIQKTDVDLDLKQMHMEMNEIDLKLAERIERYFGCEKICFTCRSFY